MSRPAGAAVRSLNNVPKPPFISNAGDLPFLLVFLQVVGGIAAFGPVGGVVGPVVPLRLPEHGAGGLASG